MTREQYEMAFNVPAPWPEGHTGHWWSGWPGAYCMKCHAAHALEVVLGLDLVEMTGDEGDGPLVWKSEEARELFEGHDTVCPSDGPESEAKFKDIVQRINILFPVGAP
jgi:hypothetical protein